MSKTGSYWREAATLIIASKTKQKSLLKQVVDSAGKKRHLIPCDYKVLMLRRSSKSKFMPDAHVFPGGIVSEADFSPKWIQVLEEYKPPFSETVKKLKQRKHTVDIFKNRTPNSSSSFKNRTPDSSSSFKNRTLDSSLSFKNRTLDSSSSFKNRTLDSSPSSINILPAEVALRICAIRECFEESGTLIARKKTDSNKEETIKQPMSSADLNSRLWRRRVHKDPDQFLVMCLEHSIVPDIWSLYEWCNWLTPPSKDRVLDEPPLKPLRYDTMFYVCCVDSIPYVRVDQREAVDIQLRSPFALLHGHLTGHIDMRGPQAFELRRLGNYSSLRELEEFLQARESKGLERWMSAYVGCKDGTVWVQNGDDLYPDDPDFEGTKEKTTYPDVTIAELREKSFHLNRMERKFEDKSETYVLRNVTIKCGQPSPIDLSSVYVPEGNL